MRRFGFQARLKPDRETVGPRESTECPANVRGVMAMFAPAPELSSAMPQRGAQHVGLQELRASPGSIIWAQRQRMWVGSTRQNQ
jgi:hypothetical protein